MRYILFHKPYDVMCQFTDRFASGRKTLKDFIAVPDVYPVGRLDHDSEGLVFLTDDGWLQHRLAHPKFHQEKIYWAQVEGIPTPEALAVLRRGGLELDRYHVRPAKVRLIDPPPIGERPRPIRVRKHIPAQWLEVKLTEGKNRQVRRMTAAVGFPTLRLVRVAIGELELGSLAPGEWRDLTVRELARLNVAAGR
jgi:23S rRNA pseudouridine2457 synthase